MPRYVRKLNNQIQDVLALALENSEYNDVIESVETSDEGVIIILTDEYSDNGKIIRFVLDEEL